MKEIIAFIQKLCFEDLVQKQPCSYLSMIFCWYYSEVPYFIVIILLLLQNTYIFVYKICIRGLRLKIALTLFVRGIAVHRVCDWH